MLRVTEGIPESKASCSFYTIRERMPRKATYSKVLFQRHCFHYLPRDNLLCVQASIEIVVERPRPHRHPVRASRQLRNHANLAILHPHATLENQRNAKVSANFANIHSVILVLKGRTVDHHVDRCNRR